MKQHLGLLLFAGIFSVSCNSQDIAADKVPAVVVNALKAQFPNAVNTDWEKNGAVYEADFDAEGGADVTVQIDASGKVLMYKTDLAAASLPTAVQTFLQNQFKDYTADEVEKIEKGGTAYYQVELDGKGLKGLKDKKLVLTADGHEATDIKYWD